MNFLKRRQQLFDQMEENAALILFSGIETHVSADEYAPFEANRNFFYLTGLRRERMILLMKKTKRDPKEILFIEEADPTQERWYGRKVTVDEAKEISQIEDVRFLESFDGVFDMMMPILHEILLRRRLIKALTIISIISSTRNGTVAHKSLPEPLMSMYGIIRPSWTKSTKAIT